MLQKALQRTFSTSSKQVCILANSRQSDKTAARLMGKVREVGGPDRPVTFTGYGGEHMRKQGFEPTVELDMDMFLDKTFVTFRKGKVHQEHL